MAKKTNKTSHVLNLITNGAASEPETDKPSGSVPAQEVENSKNSSQSVQRPSDTVAVMEAAATEEHAAALRENAAALRESAAALREAVVIAEGTEGASPNPSSGYQDDDGRADKEDAPSPGDRADKDGNPAYGEQMDKEMILEPGGQADRVDGMTVSDGQPDGEIIPASGNQMDDKDSFQEIPSVPADSAVDIKDTAGSLQPMSVPSGDKKVIVVKKSDENDKISNEILNQLTSHLEEEIKAKNLEIAAQADNPEENSPDNPEESGSDNPEEDSPDNPEEDSPDNPEESGPKQEVYRMVNVMEHILSHTNLEKEMKNYDVCMCSRCRADVRALTLTRLPAKYVVVDESSVAPIIGFYENKFKVRILTEVIKACMVVKENPRHGGSVVTEYDKS